MVMLLRVGILTIRIDLNLGVVGRKIVIVSMIVPLRVRGRGLELRAGWNVLGYASVVGIRDGFEAHMCKATLSILLLFLITRFPSRFPFLVLEGLFLGEQGYSLI